MCSSAPSSFPRVHFTLLLVNVIILKIKILLLSTIHCTVYVITKQIIYKLSQKKEIGSYFPNEKLYPQITILTHYFMNQSQQCLFTQLIPLDQSFPLPVKCQPSVKEKYFNTRKYGWEDWNYVKVCYIPKPYTNLLIQ